MCIRDSKEATSSKKRMEDILGDFDESFDLEELFQTAVDHYKEVFDDSVELKPMIGPAMKIEMKDEPIKPLHLNVPRKTPFALRDGAKAELDSLVAKGILRKLTEGEVTEWLSGASFVVKPSGGMRLVTDLVRLNQSVKRPTHPFAPVNDILSSLDPKAQFFVTLDCVGGYWQIALDEMSQQLVAFLTEWGGYLSLIHI